MIKFYPNNLLLIISEYIKNQNSLSVGYNNKIMQKVPLKDLYILETTKLNQKILKELINWNRNYQNRILKYFAKIKIQFDSLFPNISYPGIFAEVDSITGKIRPLREQKVWSWCDCRGIGIWSYLLSKNVIATEEISYIKKTVRLDCFFREYCDYVYHCIRERYILNNHHIPFIVDISTNKMSKESNNIFCKKGEYEPTHVFAAGGLMQYGIMSGNAESFHLGLKFLNESISCGMKFRNIDHIARRRLPIKSYGFLMITLGAIVDTIKCLNVSNSFIFNVFKEPLLKKGLMIAEFILNNFTDIKNGYVWEFGNDDFSPYVTAEGYIICDPGHVAELCGFIAELEGLSETLKGRFSKDLVKFLNFISIHGYSKSGIMYKHIDLLTGKGIPDRINSEGKKIKTSPWWNLRECCAASIKLYELTNNLICLKIYKKAQNSVYLHFPNLKIDGLMVQTLDPETLKPLAIAPATPNIDPLHCVRSREREIEAMTILLNRKNKSINYSNQSITKK